MRFFSLLAAVLLAVSSALYAEQPAPTPEPPAGSIKLKTTEAEAVELDEPGEVTGKVQKPTVDILMLSDPVTPEIEPPKRRDEP